MESTAAGAAVGSFAAIVTVVLGLWTARRKAKTSAVEVLEETNRIVTNHRNELQVQIDVLKRENVALRETAHNQEIALTSLGKVVTAEAAIADLKDTMVEQFKQVKGLLGNGRSG